MYIAVPCAGRPPDAGQRGGELASLIGRQVVERYTWEMRGRFGRRGARGTFELTGVVRRRDDGKRVGSCATGEIAWRAAR